MRASRHLSILGLIAVAAVVFLFEQTRDVPLSQTYGATPSLVHRAWAALADGRMSALVAQAFSRLVTALFLHGDIEHILYNMVFLWAFGYLVSQHLGQWWALAVFFVCGVCGNIVQVLLNADSMAPIIGASGAVCGFEGVYLGLALRWQLPDPDVWPLAHPIPPLQLAAFAAIGLLGDLYFLTDQTQGIAYGAHVGGFLSGLAIAAVVTTVYPTLAAYERAARKGCN
jgi:membrane associated rhomboid family serine protease